MIFLTSNLTHFRQLPPTMTYTAWKFMKFAEFWYIWLLGGIRWSRWKIDMKFQLISGHKDSNFYNSDFITDANQRNFYGLSNGVSIVFLQGIISKILIFKDYKNPLQVEFSKKNWLLSTIFSSELTSKLAKWKVYGLLHIQDICKSKSEFWLIGW